MDTTARLVLNGEVVAQPSNAHRPVKADVTELLEPAGSGQNNTLQLTIYAAPAAAQAAADDYPYTVPFVQQQGGLPNYNFIRKAASDFGWDWGPAFAPSCVTGDVTLTAYSAPFLTGERVVRTVWLADPRPSSPGDASCSERVGDGAWGVGVQPTACRLPIGDWSPWACRRAGHGWSTDTLRKKIPSEPCRDGGVAGGGRRRRD